MGLTTVTTEQQLKDIINNNKRVVIDFHSSHCLKCQIIKPAFEQMSYNHTDVPSVIVDLDKTPEIAKAWNVKAGPTFILIKFYREYKRLMAPSDADMMKLFTQ